MSNNFHNCIASEKFMNWKLLALGKGFFEKKNWRNIAVPESVQSCFELCIHFPVFFSLELYLVAVHGWFAIQTNVWKIQNTTGRFLAIPESVVKIRGHLK